METRKAWRTLAILVFLQGGGASGQPNSTPLKFELREQYQIVVHGSIGPLEGRKLLIDTGSIPSMVDRRVAKRLAVDVQKSEFVAFGRRAAS